MRLMGWATRCWGMLAGPLRANCEFGNGAGERLCVAGDGTLRSLARHLNRGGCFGERDQGTNSPLTRGDDAGNGGATGLKWRGMFLADASLDEKREGATMVAPTRKKDVWREATRREVRW